MLLPDSPRLFAQAFDTFKAFDDLTVEASGSVGPGFPTSIWQIVQHLLAWQAHQLAQLRGTALAEALDEKQSWQAARVPPSQAALQTAIAQLNHQIACFQAHASQATGEPQEVLAHAVVLQEVALHLSFHLGEVVLMRRLQGTYPLPAHMQAFLRG
jgi:hypothetical protein